MMLGQQQPRDRGEQGMAMLAAVMCVFVVVTLSAVGLSTSLGSISSGTQSRKLQQTFDAAQAGLQAELNLVGAVAAGSSASTACTMPAQPVSLSSVINGITTYYSAVLTPEESQTVTLPVKNPQACTGSYSQSTISSDPYLLITSTGTTSDPSAGGTGFGRELQALVKVTNAAAASTSYSEAATAQAANVDVVSSLAVLSTTQASATSANAGTPQTVPQISVAGAQDVLSAGALVPSSINTST